MEIQKLADKLLSLTELKIQNLPLVKYGTIMPRHLVGQLIVQGFIPSYDSAPEELKWLVESKIEFDYQPDKTIHVLDLLGVYKSYSNVIILYKQFIKLCAYQLDFDYETLRQIVLTHQLTHAITHLGKDVENSIWEYYDIASTEDIEYFAQIYTYKLFEKENNYSALDVMDKLCENQLEVFQRYKKSTNTDIAEVNKILLETRKIIPLDHELYSEAKKTLWSIKIDYIYDVCMYFSFLLFPDALNNPEWTGPRVEIVFSIMSFKYHELPQLYYDFSNRSSLATYKLIVDNKSEILKYSTTDTSVDPNISICIDKQEYYLNLVESFAQRLYDSIVDIIAKEDPDIADILKRYKKNIGFKDYKVVKLC